MFWYYLHMTQIVCFDYYGNKHIFKDTECIAHLSVYGVYVDTGRALMVKDSKSGRWEFPGGGVENRETEPEALKREVYEETGLTVSGPIRKITEISEYYYDIPTKEPWNSTRRFYRVVNTSGKMLSDGNDDDTAAVQRVNITDVKDLDISDNIQKVLSIILKD